jgi:hypothetical protein
MPHSAAPLQRQLRLPRSRASKANTFRTSFFEIPPGLSTANDFCATSPPTLSNSIATRHDLREILRIVIDDLIGTEVAQIVTVRYTRGRDDTCTDMLCKLNGETGDASCAALN